MSKRKKKGQAQKRPAAEAELSPFEAARRRMLPKEDAERVSVFMELDMESGPVDAFVLSPTLSDRQVWVALLSPESAQKQDDGTVKVTGKGDYTRANIGLMIRTLYFAPEGEEGKVGPRLFKDNEIEAIASLPASTEWVTKACDVARDLMEDGKAAAEKK